MSAKTVAKYFLNWGTICPPINFYSKNLPKVASKKDRWPLTATLVYIMPMRRLGNGKYNNQLRLGLGGKGSNSWRLVVAVDGTAAAAAEA